MAMFASVIAAIDAELTGEMFDAAQAVRDALTSQVGAATTSEVIAAVEEVIDDAVDVVGCNRDGYFVVCTHCSRRGTRRNGKNRGD